MVFKLNLNDELVEEVTFSGINDILKSDHIANGPLSSERSAQISKIIAARLPLDSQILTSYRESFNTLSEQARLFDTPKLVMIRIKRVLARARTEIRMAHKWQVHGLEIQTDRKGNVIPSADKQSAGKSTDKQSAGKKDKQPSSKETCRICGWSNHETNNCFQTNQPGTNNTTSPWTESKAGKAWKAMGSDYFKPKAEIPKSLGSSASSSSDTTTNTVQPNTVNHHVSRTLCRLYIT